VQGDLLAVHEDRAVHLGVEEVRREDGRRGM
jgi:hypothetical protein